MATVWRVSQLVEHDPYILLDGTGFGAGWFLENVVVTNEQAGTKWVFNCNRWLDKNEDDGQTVRDLVPENRLADTKVIKYKVSVHTGDKRGAGTDANVFVILHGESGDTGKRKLEGAGNNFERGKVDVFGVEAIDIGELTKITIGHGVVSRFLFYLSNTYQMGVGSEADGFWIM